MRIATACQRRDHDEEDVDPAARCTDEKCGCSCHLTMDGLIGPMVKMICTETLLAARDDDRVMFRGAMELASRLGDEVVLGVLMGWPTTQLLLLRSIDGPEPLLVVEQGGEIVDYRDLDDTPENELPRTLGAFSEAVIDANFDRINRLFKVVTDWDYSRSMTFAWSLCYGASQYLQTHLNRPEIGEAHRGHGCDLDPEKEE